MSKKKFTYTITLVPIFILLLALGWFLALVFEGEKPVLSIEPLPEFLAREKAFSLRISDRKRGLRKVKVALNQEGRETTVFETSFPFEGFLNRQGVRDFEKVLAVDPSKLGLAQGRVDLEVHVWDHSRKGGGDGNRTIFQHKMIVDTLPPIVGVISRMHNVNTGGSGLILYRASSDTRESGVYVNERFFPGFPAGTGKAKGVFVSYFAVPHDAGPDPAIYLWGMDNAENVSKTTFYYHILKKRFRVEKMKITDRFLDRVLPYFSFYPLPAEASNIEKFLEINRNLRKEDHRVLMRVTEKVSPVRLWEGPWLRLENSATMARFADHRTYEYQGTQVDEQDHLGVDLASLAHSPVQASNHGRVVFAERLGIYGLTVVLDHGQGLTSLYAHLSQIAAALGQEVKKGEIIGHTGQTGLAGGDHLHFGIMANGTFVNPLEWWDAHWIQDNVQKKLAQIEQ